MAASGREPTNMLGSITAGSPESTKKTIDQLILKNDINVSTKSDQVKCQITGCAVLPSNELVLAIKNNSKIKVISVENKLVGQQKVLDSEPWDIAVMSDNKIAVTMPKARRIDIMATDEKLSCLRSMDLIESCYGIDFHQDRLYVVCLNPNNVVVLTPQGNVLSNIPLTTLSSFSIPFIAVRKDANLLYISDYINNGIVNVALQGGVSATYEHEDLQKPSGICLLDDGSLIVCYYINGTIYHVKDDLKEANLIYKDIKYPMTICYSKHIDKVYVGCAVDQLKVLSAT